jgi:hypothetical protein
MDELDTAVAESDASAAVADIARKPKPRSALKWETEARDRLRAAIRRFSKPLADLVARDANEGDTRLLVTDFLCDGLGFDKYADLTTEYQVKGEFADYGLRIDRDLVAFIEVKRVATKLSTRHLRQVEMYAGCCPKASWAGRRRLLGTGERAGSAPAGWTGFAAVAAALAWSQLSWSPGRPIVAWLGAATA